MGVKKSPWDPKLNTSNAMSVNRMLRAKGRL